MLEGEDLPLSLSARWQVKGCECLPRTARMTESLATGKLLWGGAVALRDAGWSGEGVNGRRDGSSVEN